MEGPLPRSLDPAFLRSQIVGIDASFPGPFGERLMSYCDYTASGRCLAFVERYLMCVQRNYANTHTEDDRSGRSMTRLLHQAEQVIKDGVGAGPHGKLIAVGAGCTAAIARFQQILGVGIAPATRELLRALARSHFGEDALGSFESFLRERRPVVFVGPYEHHSNEISWRESLAEVVQVPLSADGGVDAGSLEALLREPRYRGRLRIGSFSAASNVTGRITPVHELAALLHRHDALACFDYAASAPYVAIEMDPGPGPEGEDRSLDAVFLSPHKYLGGPGSSGVLVFHERLYRGDLPPTTSGGGTVSYVGPHDHDFLEDIEEREKAGTPAVLQTMKAALAFRVKEAVGVERIAQREKELLERAFARWGQNPDLEILGNPDPRLRIPIVSFLVRDPRGRYLHPRLLTVLLNDLFGIQSRAGCSCAGPYGHALLGIDEPTSERYRKWVERGCQGIKPGWCRIGFHYTMDDEEADFIIDAVDFLARRGWLFLPLYRFDLDSASWTHREDPGLDEEFSLERALRLTDPVPPRALPPATRVHLYRGYLAEAEERARALEAKAPEASAELEGELGELQFFTW